MRHESPGPPAVYMRAPYAQCICHPYRDMGQRWRLRYTRDSATCLRGLLTYYLDRDLSNASPSTDQPTLWLTLQQRRALGELINWLCMLSYSDVSKYRTRNCYNATYRELSLALGHQEARQWASALLVMASSTFGFAWLGSYCNLSGARSGRGPAHANRLKERAGL